MLRQSHQDFSERLRKARFRAGFKGPAEAADAHRWNKNTYKSRENGLRGIPDHEDVREYADAFNVPFLWLLAGEGPAPVWDEKHVSPLGQRSAAPPIGRPTLPHNGSIQVALDDLRTVFRDVARLGGIEVTRAEALADAAIVMLREQPVVDVVHRLGRLSRTDPGSAVPALVDPK